MNFLTWEKAIEASELFKNVQKNVTLMSMHEDKDVMVEIDANNVAISAAPSWKGKHDSFFSKRYLTKIISPLVKIIKNDLIKNFWR